MSLLTKALGLSLGVLALTANATTISNGGLTANLNAAGNFDNTASGMLSWNGHEVIQYGTYFSFYTLSSGGTDYIADFASNPLSATTLGVSSSTALSLSGSAAGWSFLQTVQAVTPNLLTYSITLTNTSGSAQSAKWAFGFDPDQDVGSSVGSYYTTNTILGQGVNAAVSAAGKDVVATLRNTSGSSATAYVNGGWDTSPLGTLTNGQAVGYSNYSDSVISLGYDLGTVNAGRSVTFGYSVELAAPVPEPETYAMMLAGLGVMGFMARRRKPQA